jgi:Ca2+/Na+ antiporter
MWIFEYFKEHIAETINSTKISLKKKLTLPIIMIIVPAIIGFFINNTYLIKVFISILCGFGGLVSYCFLVFLFHLFKTPIDIYKKDKEAIKSLEGKQKTKLIIEFDRTSKDYRKEISQKNTNPNTRHIYDCFELTWQISIRNKSTVATIKGVKAKLAVVGSDSKKATHLKFADYNDKPYPRSVDISPTDSEFVEVINWYMVHGKEKEEKLECEVCNIELDHNYNRIPSFFYVGKNDCKIKIEVLADNAPSVSKYFNIGIRNNDNTINKICMWEA